MKDYIAEHDIVCPVCGKNRFHRHPPVQPDVQDLPGREPRMPQAKLYLRPETAQGIFVNFAERPCAPRAKSCRPASAQIGKSFRNEITPGNFIFRVREFEQMELEFFCKPGDRPGMVPTTGVPSAATGCCSLGMKRRKPAPARPRDRKKLAFYSKATTDFEFLFPFGWGELWGVADRTDYDLTQHQQSLRQDAWNISIR